MAVFKTHVRQEAGERAAPRSVLPKEITLAPPPQTPRKPPATGFQRIGPILMVVAVGGMVWFMMSSGMMRSGFGMIMPIMLLVSMGMMMANRGGTGQSKGQVSKDRADYAREIDRQRTLAIESGRAQFEATEFNYPPPDALALRVGSARMWERRPDDKAFATVRVGLGTVSAARHYAPVKIGALGDQEPASVQAVNDFIYEQSVVRDIPRPVSLAEQPVWSLTGDREAARASARAMVAHLAFFHGPDDLLIAVVCDEESAPGWDHVKWLPHSRVPGGRRPLVFGSTDELVAGLGEQLRDRGHFSGRNIRLSAVAEAGGASTVSTAAATTAHVVVICDAAGMGWDGLVVDGKGREAVTLLDLTGQCPLPTPVSTLDYHDGQVDHSDTVGKPAALLAVPDAMSVSAAEAVARRVAGYRPGTKASRMLAASGETAASIDLLELLGIEDAANFDVAEAWRWSRSRRNLLRVPVGRFMDSGRTWYLDLKEDDASNGPHIGLAGATGSGKSEFLRVLVLALCMTHSPDDLVLTPADFKGNKTFAGLERLPHVLFVLNNLEGSRDRIARLRQAFQGELEHRQRLLDSVGELAKDITEYRALRRKRPELNLEPMPHWFIPFDELMQAKRESPELITIMEICGTVGRSLGAHMMPVSQNFNAGLMSGIDTHLRARIALRMNDPSDYREILGATNPGGLPPGRKGVGYLALDKDGSSAPQRIESCYVSGPYVPPAQAAEIEEVRARREHFKPMVLSGLSDRAAAVIESTYSAADRPEEDLSTAGDDADDGLTATAADGDQFDADEFDDDSDELDSYVGPTTMSTVIDTLESHGVKPRNFWLPELDVYTAVTLFAEKYLNEVGPPTAQTLAAPCGIVDKPRDLKQETLAVHFAQNTAIVGQGRSGKSSALLSMIMGAAWIYSPERIQFYCIDNGGGLQRQAQSLAHVGDVVAGGDVYGRMRILNHLSEVVRRRERQWGAAGVFSVDEWRTRRFGGAEGEVPDDEHGDVVLVIDGAEKLCESEPEIKDQILQLCGSGPAFGVNVVLSYNSWNSKGMHTFAERVRNIYELKLGEATDSKMGRASAEAVPGMPGRGLIAASGEGAARRDEISASFGNQKSIPRDAADHILFGAPAVAVAGSATALSAGGASVINDRFAGHRPAPAVPALPELVSFAEMAPAPAGSVVLGLRESDLRAQLWTPQRDGHLFVLGEGEAGKSTTLGVIGRQLQHWKANAAPGEEPVVMVFDSRQSLLGVVPSADQYVHDRQQIPAAIEFLGGLVTGRSGGEVLDQQALLQRRARGEHGFSGPRVFVLIDNYTDFVEGYDDPFAPFERAADQGAGIGVHFVVSRLADQSAHGASPRGLMAALSRQAPVLLMSSDPDLANLVGRRRGQRLPAGRGLYIHRDQQMMIQVPLPDPQVPGGGEPPRP